MVKITFEIKDEHAPALRSAVDEISNTVGTRMESRYSYDVEDALVRASIALGTLRAAVCEKIPEGDAHYRGRK